MIFVGAVYLVATVVFGRRAVRQFVIILAIARTDSAVYFPISVTAKATQPHPVWIPLSRKRTDTAHAPRVYVWHENHQYCLNGGRANSLSISVYGSYEVREISLKSWSLHGPMALPIDQ